MLAILTRFTVKYWFWKEKKKIELIFFWHCLEVSFDLLLREFQWFSRFVFQILAVFLEFSWNFHFSFGIFHWLLVNFFMSHKIIIRHFNLIHLISFRKNFPSNYEILLNHTRYVTEPRKCIQKYIFLLESNRQDLLHTFHTNLKVFFFFFFGYITWKFSRNFFNFPHGFISRINA